MNIQTGARPTSNDRHGRRFVRFVPAIAVGVSLIAAGPASAAKVTADYGNGVLSIQGSPGETSQLLVAAGNGSYTIEEQNTSLSLAQIGGGTCKLPDPGLIRCPQAGILRAVIDLADGSDQLDLRGTSLPATVTGRGPGRKEIKLGAGNDQVSLRDGVADQIDCGDGEDTVVSDSQDTVSSNCEHVNVSADTSVPSGGDTGLGLPGVGSGGSPTGDGSAGDPNGRGEDDNSLTAPIGIVLPSRPVELPSPNTAIVHVGCAATETDGCQGDVILELPGKASHPRTTKRVSAARGHFVAQQHHRLGKGHFKLAAGQSADVPVRITLRGHFAQASKRHSRRGILKIVVRDSTGKVTGVETRVVTLKLSNKWSRIRRHAK